MRIHIRYQLMYFQEKISTIMNGLLLDSGLFVQLLQLYTQIQSLLFVAVNMILLNLFLPCFFVFFWTRGFVFLRVTRKSVYKRSLDIFFFSKNLVRFYGYTSVNVFPPVFLITFMDMLQQSFTPAFTISVFVLNLLFNVQKIFLGYVSFQIF